MLSPSLPLLLAAALLAAAPPGDARQYDRPAGRQDNGRAERGGMSLDQAVEQVRRETGGRVLSADTVSGDGRRVHRIKVLTPDRRVRVISIGAGGR